MGPEWVDRCAGLNARFEAPAEKPAVLPHPATPSTGRTRAREVDLASADFAFPPSLPAKSVVRQRGEGVMVTVVVAEVVWRRS